VVRICSVDGCQRERELRMHSWYRYGISNVHRVFIDVHPRLAETVSANPRVEVFTEFVPGIRANKLHT
jgi:hypothetical protein